MKIFDFIFGAGMWMVAGWLIKDIHWQGTHTCFEAAHAISCSVHEFHWSIFSRLWT